MDPDCTKPSALRRVVVLGAGALGSLLGGKFAAVLPVALVGRKGHLEAIRTAGLRISGLSKLTLGTGANLALAENLAELQPPLSAGDVILLAVKAQQAADAARALSEAVEKIDARWPLPVYALQNGTGFEEPLRANLSNAFALYHAVSHVGAAFVAPGHVEDWGGEILLPNDACSHALAEAFRQAHIKARCLADLEIWRWKKIAFNCALNPLGAILEARNKDTLRAELRPLLRAVLGEVRVEAAARGLRLPTVNDLLAEFEQRAGASNNVNSMWQDILARKPTELSFLNAAILSLARARGNDTPANATLTAWIRRLEESPNAQTQKELREKAVLELTALAAALPAR